MSGTTYRWIMYPQLDGLPSPSGMNPVRVSSLAKAREQVEQVQMDYNHDAVSAFLYPFDAESWALAEDFRGVGNPFDYPSKVIETGPRGGLVISNA